MDLSKDEKLAILRAADELIGEGGRNLLVKILKGSREKKVLELELDQSPVYGYLHSETIAAITEKLDWMIEHDFLEISYSGKLPMIVYTSRGWEIEADQRADEFLIGWNRLLMEGAAIPDMEYLKDRNRHMIFLFLDKIRKTGDTKYIPLLEEWEKIEYKKVRAKIQDTILSIKENTPIDLESVHQREAEIEEALEGERLHDFQLKCWDCGSRYILTIEEKTFLNKKDYIFRNDVKDAENSGSMGTNLILLKIAKMAMYSLKMKD